MDPNANGTTSSLRIVELLFGRLVDIHDIDAMGNTNQTPIFQDYLVELDLLGSAAYRLESNPLTGRERLVILVERATDAASFDTLMAAASDDLVSVVPRNDDGLDPGPFSVIPRNCSISIRFNDMLDDGAAAVAALQDNIKLLVGNMPIQPFFARLLFDPNHGAIFQGNFHSTRVIVDLAVSDAEAAASGGALMANTVGLPAGDNTSDPNVSIRIPTRTVAAGQPTIQLTLLRSVSGQPLDFGNNGPVSTNSTRDVVRAFRPGNASQSDNGFMPDGVAPEILGTWDLTVNSAVADMTGTPTFDFLLDVTFDTACRSAMDPGDLIEMGTEMLLVTETMPVAPDMAGNIPVLRVRSLSAVANAAALVGAGGFFVSPLDPALTGIDGCWVRFTGSPSLAITGTGPVTGVSTTAELNVRFSEPMDPVSMSLLDRMVLVAGDATTLPTAHNRVAGSYVGDSALENFTLVHPVPFSHQAGMQETYTLGVGTPASNLPVVTASLPTDLAGNVLINPLPPTEFTINAGDAARATGSVILRFDREYRSPAEPFAAGVNEINSRESTVPGQRISDFSGSFIYDLNRGEIRGREPSFQSFVIDGSQPSVAGMLGLPISVAEPLNRLGAKTMTLWRHFDMGMFANQASTLDVDVVGLNWAPNNGIVIRDIYPSFEIKLGTSQRLPEESFTQMAPAPPSLTDADSGLLLNDLTTGDPVGFSGNALGGGAGLVTVHDRNKGYTVRTIDRFDSSTGLPMVPFPLNQGLAPGESMTSYTWRDSGNPEVSDQMIAIPSPSNASFYGGTLPPGNLESEVVGLIHPTADSIQAAVMPLLMEFNCFASGNAIGTNRFMAGLLAPGVDATLKPYSRIFSSGGTNSLGFPQMVNPDSADFPTGGFNPVTGAATSAADNVYYLGQLDTVFRVTRLVSHWIDLIGVSFTGEVAFDSAILEPASSMQPLGTSVQLDYRAATGFAGNQVRPFDPRAQGPNGNPVDHFDNGSTHSINFQAANPGTNTVSGRLWNSDLSQMKSRYLQVRISMINNINTGTTPFLSALAFPFDM